MRRVSILLLAVCLLPLGNLATAQQVRLSEPLLGGNENPPVISGGSGRFRAQLFNNRIEFRLRYAGLTGPQSDVTQAHLHIANPGNNGGIVAFLCTNLGNAPSVPECPPSPEVIEGEIVAADVLEVTDESVTPPVTVIEAGDLRGLARLIRQGAVYANVHTDDHPGGEVRGQISPRNR
jgi:hypothetical protein